MHATISAVGAAGPPRPVRCAVHWGMVEGKDERPQQTVAYITFGVLLVIAGAFMTRGTLGPFVGLIVALIGIALLVVGLIRHR